MTDVLEAGGNMLEKVLGVNEDAVVSRHIAGETILVPIRGLLADMQKIYVLDTVGELIWQNLDGKRNVKEISREVLKAFEVGAEEAEADTVEFLAALVRERLVAERV
jgi:hypothetical protein